MKPSWEWRNRNWRRRRILVLKNLEKGFLIGLKASIIIHPCDDQGVNFGGWRDRDGHWSQHFGLRKVRVGNFIPALLHGRR